MLENKDNVPVGCTEKIHSYGTPLIPKYLFWVSFFQGDNIDLRLQLSVLINQGFLISGCPFKRAFYYSPIISVTRPSFIAWSLPICIGMYVRQHSNVVSFLLLYLCFRYRRMTILSVKRMTTMRMNSTTTGETTIIRKEGCHLLLSHAVPSSVLLSGAV